MKNVIFIGEGKAIAKESKLLNLGCGTKAMAGWVNLDIQRLRGVDVVHDLNKFPYPFPDNHFDFIYARHVLEHLGDTVRVMKELHRITKRGCKLQILVPHYSGINAWSNPEHVTAFTVKSMHLFQDKGLFEIKNVELRWKVLGHTSTLPMFFQKIINRVVNKYERLALSLGGCDEIEFRLVKK